MIVLASFSILAALTFSMRGQRGGALNRDGAGWVLDASGLLVQGVLIPLLQITLIYRLFASLAPQLEGAIEVHPAAAFLLNFVFVDYLYYWNHRLLHAEWLWRAHAVHHTAE